MQNKLAKEVPSCFHTVAKIMCGLVNSSSFSRFSEQKRAQDQSTSRTIRNKIDRSKDMKNTLLGQTAGVAHYFQSIALYRSDLSLYVRFKPRVS